MEYSTTSREASRLPLEGHGGLRGRRDRVRIFRPAPLGEINRVTVSPRAARGGDVRSWKDPRFRSVFWGSRTAMRRGSGLSTSKRKGDHPDGQPLRPGPSRCDSRTPGTLPSPQPGFRGSGGRKVAGGMDLCRRLRLAALGSQSQSLVPEPPPLSLPL